MSDGKQTPGISRYVPLLILTLITSLCTFFFLRVSDIVMFVPFFAFTTAIETFLLCGLKNIAVFLIPLASSVLCFPNYLPAVICFFVLVSISALFTALLSAGAESFSFFITSALVYSVVAGAAFVFLSIMVFGSLSASLEYISDMSLQLMKTATEGYPEEVVSLYLEVAEMTVYVLPSVICAVGFFAAWISKWTLSSCCKKVTPAKPLYTKTTTAPVALAVIYIIMSLFGFLFASGEGSLAFSVVNINAVLTMIFIGEGFREYFSVLFRHGETKQKFIYIVVGIGSVIILQASAISILAYFGAYRTVFNKLRTVKIQGE